MQIFLTYCVSVLFDFNLTDCRLRYCKLKMIGRNLFKYLIKIMLSSIQVNNFEKQVLVEILSKRVDNLHCKMKRKNKSKATILF